MAERFYLPLVKESSMWKNRRIGQAKYGTAPKNNSLNQHQLSDAGNASGEYEANNRC